MREDDNISFITQKGQEQHSKRDPRYYIADELLQTEKNHVSILTTIVKVMIDVYNRNILWHYRFLYSTN